MKDAEFIGDVRFHLVDGDVAVLFPLDEDFTVVIKLDVQYDGDARNVFHMISIGWTSDGELVS